MVFILFIEAREGRKVKKESVRCNAYIDYPQSLYIVTAALKTDRNYMQNLSLPAQFVIGFTISGTIMWVLVWLVEKLAKLLTRGDDDNRNDRYKNAPDPEPITPPDPGRIEDAPYDPAIDEILEELSHEKFEELVLR